MINAPAVLWAQENPQGVAYLILSIILYLAKSIFALWRRNRYLEELLRRANEKSLNRQNEIVKTLTEAFLREPTPSLKDLVAATEATWSVEALEEPSEGNDTTKRIG